MGCRLKATDSTAGVLRPYIMLCLDLSFGGIAQRYWAKHSGVGAKHPAIGVIAVTQIFLTGCFALARKLMDIELNIWIYP